MAYLFGSSTYSSETLKGGLDNDTFNHYGGSDTIDGGGGTDTSRIYSDSSYFTITQLGGVTKVIGNSYAYGYDYNYYNYYNYSYDTLILVNVEKIQFSDRTVSLTTSSDNFVFGSSSSRYSSDSLYGTAGNDTFDHQGGSDTIDGGAGTDTSLIFSNSGYFTVTTSGDTTKVYGNSGAGDYAYSTLTLKNVEKIQFLDKTVTVTPSNRSPEIAGQTFSIAENSAENSAVGTMSATDADGNTIAYSLTGGNTDVDGDGQAAFSINATTGAISVNDAGDLDYENTRSFSLKVQASDGLLSSTATATVNLDNVNEAPTLSSQTFSIAENSAEATAVGFVSAKDPESAAIRYSITAGNTDVDGDGQAAFAINAATGAISVNDAGDLDYENTQGFSLTVQASDGALSASATATVNLANVNEAPILSSQAFSIAENSAEATAVGFVSATDAESAAIRYSISGGNTDVDGDGQAAFSINATTGAISVNDAGDLDYESTKGFNLTVQAFDGALSASATATVNLGDVNEAPVLSSQAFSVAENPAEATAVGSVSAKDPESAAIRYSITGGNTDVDGDGQAAFAINATTGAISVNDAGDLDYESTKGFNLTVQAFDGALSSSATATVNLANVNEALTGSVAIGGDAIQGSALTIVSTLSDPDGLASTAVQWLRDGSAISGATSSSYTLAAADIGKSIAARVSYTDGAGSTESRTTAAVTGQALNPSVVITGDDKVTGEDGNTAVFSVKLDKAPVDSVTIQFAVSDATEAKLLNSSLTFTADNWNVAQSLTVTGVDDYDNDKNVSYNLTAKIVTGDLSYKRVIVDSIGLTNNDDTEDAPFQKYGSDGIDYLKGKNGADRLYGRGDMDRIEGGRGDDRIYGQEDDDELFGGEGNDRVYGGYDDDLVDGGNGNDKLFGEEGDDTVQGGAGNDTLDGGEGADSMVGGAGNDTYYVDDAGDVIDDQGDASDDDTVIVMSTITYKLGANIENAELQDASGAASLTGNSLSNELDGNDSKNQLDGGAGSDSLDGGAGNDTLLGGEGTDTIIGGLGNDTINGGAGDDLADFSDAAAGFVNVNLTTGKAKGDGADTLVSIEDVIGSEGDDTLVGSAADNELTGGLGDDQISGGGGADLLYAGTGDDTVDGGDGNDTLVGGDGAGDDKYVGGAGSDTIKYTSATAGITVDLAKGSATSTAGNDAAGIGSDTLSGIENVIAGNYDDIVKGNADANRLTGGLGTDNLWGGVDKVQDIFDFNAIGESKTGLARDWIYDFVSKTDQIDLADIDANIAAAKSGDQAFAFSGTTAKANSVWYVKTDLDGDLLKDDLVIRGDVNGNTTSDFEIGLINVSSLVSGDFLL